MSSSTTSFVEIKQGKVKGITAKTVDGGKYLAFCGIPYAQPPIGELRFKDPLPPKSWDGIRNLPNTSPKAVQYDMVMNYITGTEDCLYLNVATNSLDGKRPVMVWIHGGGFSMSTAGYELYGPDYLLKQDIVYVSIGYRLGCLGFLNLDLPDATGNQGMKDQVAGLIWIQKNIEAFGGDPGNVTIIGESAGSVCVHLLTISPLAKGLFHKAIAQSGVANSPWAFSDNPVEAGLRLADILGNRSTDPNEALKILMKASTDQLIKAQRQLNYRNMDSELVFNFRPSLDSKSLNPFMPEPPKERFKLGVNVPLMIGATSEEGLISINSPCLEDVFWELNTDFAGILARDLGIREADRVAKIVNPVQKFYFGETAKITTAKNAKDYVKMTGDLYFYNGIQQLIEIQSNLSTPTYLYEFSYRPSYTTFRKLMTSIVDVPGSGHGDELGALFHSPCFMGKKELQKGTKDYLVMERLTRMWANFARTGNPTVKLDEQVTTKWEPITKDKINYMDINEELVPRGNYHETSWKFWKPILETL